MQEIMLKVKKLSDTLGGRNKKFNGSFLGSTHVQDLLEGALEFLGQMINMHYISFT